MESEIWGLPGPAAFVRRTADELADGNSVVVGFPVRGERGFGAAVGQVVEGAGLAVLGWQSYYQGRYKEALKAFLEAIDSENAGVAYIY